jgi:hypothetical protein
MAVIRVTAPIRAPDKLTAAHPNPPVITGQLTDRLAAHGSGRHDRGRHRLRLATPSAHISSLTNEPSTGRIRTDLLGHDTIGAVMARADIAAFPVSQITDTRHLRAVPAISN